MDLRLLVRVPSDDPPRTALEAIEVRIRASRPVTAGELAATLGHHLARPSPTIECDGTVVDPDATLGMPPLTTGARLLLAVTQGPEQHHGHDPLTTSPARGPRREGREGVVDLVIPSGPDCGHRFPLTSAGLQIGRPSFCDVGLHDLGVSRRHARLDIGPDGVHLLDLDSTNGTMVDGSFLVNQARAITADSRICVGHTRLRLTGPPPAPAMLQPLGDGHLRIEAVPRSHQPPPAVSLSAPRPPTPTRSTSPPWITMLVPLPIAVALAIFFGPHFLLFAALGPVTMGASWLHERRRRRHQQREEQDTYERALEDLGSRVAEVLDQERAWLDLTLPTAVTTLDIAISRACGLWSRPRDGAGFGTVRLGMGDRPSTVVTVHGEGRVSDRRSTHAEAPVVQACPITVDCTRPLLVSGPPEHTRAVLRHLIGQLAVLHDPADLQIALISASSEADTVAAADWAWLRDLPHNHQWRDLDLSRPADRAALEAELRKQSPVTGPFLVLVVPSRADLGRWPELAALATSLMLTTPTTPTTPGVSRQSPHVSMLLSDARESSATTAHGPTESQVVLGQDSTVLRQVGAPDQDLVADGVGLWWAQRLAHALAPLVTERTLRLLHGQVPQDPWALHDLRSPTDPERTAYTLARLGERWRPDADHAQRPGRAPRPRAIVGLRDGAPWVIDLVEDGPHLLVGGTTGSGKSEFLRALVLGLALDQSPRAVTFLLMDFKGGSAFGRCADLPHTVGLVTDLDASLATRALASLRAEIRRREALLSTHDVEDFDGYWAKGAGHHLDLPRLVVVIDEFRVLAHEHPDVLAGLVHCASVGRSLGIHLVLATQRPTGVVSPEIQANVNLRIALRMRDAADSDAVVGSTDAALLDPTQPGTGLARLGTGELVSFRTLHVAGPLTLPVPDVRVDILGGPASSASKASDGDDPDRPTGAPRESQEDALVRVLREAHAATGDPGVQSPWLPPLPACLPAGWEAGTPGGSVPWGLVDCPEEQAQRPHVWDAGAPWRIVGGPGGGRTTAVVGLVHRLAERFGPQDWHVYAVDDGSSLAPLADLPHVGAVIDGSQVGRLRLLLRRLEEETRRRPADESGPSAPRILVVIDDGDRLARPDSATQEVFDRLLTVCLDGRSRGLHLVVAGGPALATNRCLREARTACLGGVDLSVLMLHGIRTQDLPRDWPPGRAVLVEGGHHLQFGPADPARVRLGPWGPGLPAAITDLPTRLSASDVAEGPRADALAPPGPLLGLGHDGPVRWDPDRWGRHLLVVGPGGTGRTTTLATLARELEASGRHTILVSADAPSTAAAGGPTLRPDDVAGLRAALEADPTTALLVDDADAMSGSPVDLALPELVEGTDRRHGLVVVAIRQHTLATAFRGVVPQLAQRQTALVLAPQSRHDGDAIGVRLDLPTTTTPGRGVLVVRGRQQEIQVALP